MNEEDIDPFLGSTIDSTPSPLQATVHELRRLMEDEWGVVPYTEGDLRNEYQFIDPTSESYVTDAALSSPRGTLYGVSTTRMPTRQVEPLFYYDHEEGQEYRSTIPSDREHAVVPVYSLIEWDVDADELWEDVDPQPSLPEVDDSLLGDVEWPPITDDSLLGEDADDERWKQVTSARLSYVTEVSRQGEVELHEASPGDQVRFLSEFQKPDRVYIAAGEVGKVRQVRENEGKIDVVVRGTVRSAGESEAVKTIAVSVPTEHLALMLHSEDARVAA